MRLASVLALPLLLTGCLADFDFTPVDEPVFEGAEPSIDHGSWLSMDVAPDGKRMVMAYYDRERGGLGFATGTPADDGTVTWLHERVDGYEDPSSGLDVGDRGQYASMKVAPDGTVWIVYYDVGKKSLYYAHRKGGPDSWVTGLVDGGGGLSIPDAGTWASLALDANGGPVVAYQDASTASLKVARPADLAAETLSWNVETVFTGSDFVSTAEDGTPIFREADAGSYARIAIAGVNEYIAFYDAAQQRLALAEGSAGAYQFNYVTPEGANMGQWPSILLDSGTVNIAFHDVGNQDLVVATRTGGGFELEVADAGNFVGADTEIHKRAGNLAVLYFDGQDNDMKLATKNGAVWVTETLGDPDRAVGFHNEVVRVGAAWYAGSYDFTNRQVFLHVTPDP
jgi:hypothetical protein